MKTAFKTLIFLLLTAVVDVSLTCCKDTINPDIVKINETFEYWDEGKHKATITYDNCTSEELIGNGIQNILIVETLTIAPLDILKLNEPEFLLGVGYDESGSDPNQRYNIDGEYTLQKNELDLFKISIEESITYNFCFVIPKEKYGVTYDQRGISFEAFLHSMVYFFH